MLISGLGRFGGGRRMNGLRFHGHYASFGEDIPTDGMSDEPLGPERSPTTQGVTFDAGGLAAGIGAGLGALATGIASFFVKPQQNLNMNTNPYGNQQQQQSDNTLPLIIGAGVLGVGAVLLLTRK